MNPLSAATLVFTLLASLAVAEEKRNQAKVSETENHAHTWDAETWDSGSATTFWRAVGDTDSGEHTNPTVCNSSTSSLKSGK